jgi:hypothetical protein
LVENGAETDDGWVGVLSESPVSGVVGFPLSSKLALPSNPRELPMFSLFLVFADGKAEMTRCCALC